jgi:DNA-binding Lrp family transcriptional regulator
LDLQLAATARLLSSGLHGVDATISVAELAEKFGLTATPCWRRIRKLEERGIIKKRVAPLDPGPSISA